MDKNAQAPYENCNRYDALTWGSICGTTDIIHEPFVVMIAAVGAGKAAFSFVNDLCSRKAG